MMKRGEVTDCEKCLSVRKGFPKSPKKCARGWKIGSLTARKDGGTGASILRPLVNLDRLSFKGGGFILAGYMTGKVTIKPEGEVEHELGIGSWRLESCPDFSPEPKPERGKNSSTAKEEAEDAEV